MDMDGSRRKNQPLRAFLAVCGLALATPATPAQQDAPDPILPGDELIQISQFSEPLQLGTLIELVAEELEIDITIQGEVSGTVSFVAPRTIPKRDLLPLLERLLDQNNFTLMYDRLLDRYMVRPGQIVAGGAAVGEFATTRIIPTPNLRPSQLTEAINAYSAAVGGIGQISFLDDLGVVVVTGSPVRARDLEAYINSFVEHASRMEFTRIELRYISATAARQRAIQLTSGSSGTTTPIAQPGQRPDQQAALSTARSVDNLSDRLTVEPNGNGLFFRGLPEELDRVRYIVSLIDQPTDLRPREFFAGALATQVARIASAMGLGEVLEIDDPNALATGGTQAALLRQQQQAFQNQFAAGRQTTMEGGSRMIVDAQRGRILHYGTEEQQIQLAALVAELRTDGERIVIREYKLENAIAENVAELLQALVDGGNRTGDAPLLPGVSQPGQTTRAQPDRLSQGEGAFTARAEEVFVGFYQPQNLVLVKAPIDVQDQFADLINRLDERSPQVYLEVQIVSVTNTDDFRFAVETQIFAGQYGLQTNFGLTDAPTGGDFLDRRNVNTSLPGLTTALIRSEYLPFVINAIQTRTDARIVSSPQLLVNDNAEASIISDEQQPTTSTSQGDGSTITSFSGFESAGTKLTVRPVISSGGYVRLEYEIELSNFQGTGSAGIPPPRFTRTVNAEAVTVPGDSTIVVGGITVNDIRKEKDGIPILMDIPILGAAFSDTREIESESLLYVFITPRIMRDESFRDLRLLTRGPQSLVEVPEDMPSLSPVFMDSMPLGESRLLQPPTIRVPSASQGPEAMADPARSAPSAPGASTPTPSRPVQPSQQEEWPEQRPTLMTPVRDSD